MSWAVQFTKQALQDIDRLDKAIKIQVFKAIRKVAVNPLPASEGGYGKPLGNRLTARLTGYYKIKLKRSGMRVVYSIIRQDDVMIVVVVSVRDDETVYKLAYERLGK